MKTLMSTLNKLHEYKNTNGTISMFIKLHKSKAIQSLVFSVSMLSAIFMVPFSQAEGVQIQHLVPFQGRLHGADNQPVQNGRYDITFSLYDTAVGGKLIWSEIHKEVSVIQGYTNVVLGADSAFEDSDQNKINFGQQLYIGISVNQGAELFPRQQLIPTFHAVTANDAKTLDGNEPDFFATQLQVTTLSGDYSGFKDRFNTLELTPRLNEDGTEMKVIDPITNEPTDSTIVRVEHAKDADTLDGKDSSEFIEKNTYFESSYEDEVEISTIVKQEFLPKATTTHAGIVSKATNEEELNGVRDRFVDAEGVHEILSSVSTTPQLIFDGPWGEGGAISADEIKEYSGFDMKPGFYFIHVLSGVLSKQFISLRIFDIDYQHTNLNSYYGNTGSSGIVWTGNNFRTSDTITESNAFYVHMIVDRNEIIRLSGGKLYYQPF